MKKKTYAKSKEKYEGNYKRQKNKFQIIEENRRHKGNKMRVKKNMMNEKNISKKEKNG